MCLPKPKASTQAQGEHAGPPLPGQAAPGPRQGQPA